MSVSRKRIAIVQSNYIPWKGYFDLIHRVDEFILYDEMQYTRRDWRNRNKIKTPQGLKWLTIPIKVKGNYYQKINQAVVSSSDWAKKHWKSIHLNYARARYFKDYAPIINRMYLDCDSQYLSEINYQFLKGVSDILGINTLITSSSDYELSGDKSERLLNLCLQSEATDYLSGPASKKYLDVELFTDQGISVFFIDYSGYPEYEQLYPPFSHHVSVLDLIFNAGPNALGLFDQHSRIIPAASTGDSSRSGHEVP